MPDRGAGREGGYLRPGFVLALTVRLLTAALAIVVPLYAVGSLGASPSAAGVFVLLLWVGNAAGTSAAVLLLRDQSVSPVAGFALVALSLGGLARGGPSLAWLFILSSGVGVGLPQPFLPAFMHGDSGPDRPFLGLGLYSAALGIGLVLGPLVAYGAYPGFGFGGVFLALAAVCAVGLGAAVLGRGAAASRASPSVPSASAWVRAFRDLRFRSAITVNFLYSLLLPLFLSYAGILAERGFGLSPSDALLLFTGVFTVSVALRLASARLKSGLGRLVLAAAALLFVSMLSLGAARSLPLFLAGMMLFSVPHAYVFPVANYFALSSEEDVMNASYAFQASSAAAEFITPAAAVLFIPLTGVQGLFLLGVMVAAGVFYAALRIGRASTT